MKIETILQVVPTIIVFQYRSMSMWKYTVMSYDKIAQFNVYRSVMLVLGLGPGLKDSIRTGDKSLVLSLALKLSPCNSP